MSYEADIWVVPERKDNIRVGVNYYPTRGVFKYFTFCTAGVLKMSHEDKKIAGQRIKEYINSGEYWPGELYS